MKALICAVACGCLALAGLHYLGHGCPGARILGSACASAEPDDEQEAKGKPTLSSVWVQIGGQLVSTRPNACWADRKRKDQPYLGERLR